MIFDLFIEVKTDAEIFVEILTLFPEINFLQVKKIRGLFKRFL